MRCVMLLAVAGLMPVVCVADLPRLEEVVVTASLHAATAQDLAASVTVLQAGTVTDAAVQHFEELLIQVPSLSWAGASSRPRYFQLRGIGELEQYQGAPNPSVGFLVDEIDFSGIGMVATLFDVEQVEVLRGPQGTRYGANALAGLIKIKTRDPRPERELAFETSVGEDGLRAGGVIAGGALPEAAGEGAAWRLAVQQTDGDGFRRNAFLGRNDTNARDELTARARLRLHPADALGVDLTLLHADLDNGYDAFAIDNSYVTRSDRPGRDAQRSTGASADLRYAPARGLRLRSITTWADSAIDSSFDGDWGNDPDWGAAGPYDYFSQTLRERRTLSQDLRIESDTVGPWSWVAGAYLLKLREENTLLEDGRYLSDSFLREFASDYRAASIALYGDAEWRAGDRLTLGAGLRAEQRDARYADSDLASFSPRDRMWGGQLSAAWQLGDGTRAWLAVARGFKAGGFNIGTSVPSERLQFEPEYAWSVEGGLKAAWPAHGVVADLSAYHVRRERAQVATSFQLDPQDPLTFVYLTDNAARGRASGLEGALRWQVAPRVELSASLSLQDSAYRGYRYGDRDLDGREWAHAPAWKYSLAATWRHPAGWMLRADLGAQAAFYFDAGHDERSRAYEVLNLRAGYERERWSVHAWLRNALDEEYAVRGFYFGNEPPDFPERLYLRLGDPRQAGLTARVRF